MREPVNIVQYTNYNGQRFPHINNFMKTPQTLKQQLVLKTNPNIWFTVQKYGNTKVLDSRATDNTYWRG